MLKTNKNTKNAKAQFTCLSIYHYKRLSSAPSYSPIQLR